MKQESINAIVIESLPNLQFKIKLPDEKEVIAYTSGKMRLHNIKVIIGDKVEVILDPMKGKATNRIIRRL